MDPAFDRLAKALGPAVAPGGLIAALQVLRAPRHLVGIVPMARQFRDWRGRYPALNTLPEALDYTASLAILDRIADLEVEDDALMGRVAAHRNAWTPLRPWTGDSVIGELLLVQAEDVEHADAFARVAVWLVWQAQRFQMHTVASEAYTRYLGGRRRSDRLNAGRGSRLYGAYLALQSLTRDAAGGERLEALAALVMGPAVEVAIGLSAEASVRLTLLARLTRLAEGGARATLLRRHALQQLGFAEAQLSAEVERVRDVLPPEFARVLVTVWGGAVRAAAGGGGVARHRRAPDRPLIRHGERLTEILGRVDEDEVHAGDSVALFPEPPAAAPNDRERDPDDPAETAQLEPAVTLYLADDADLLRAHYGAKGLQAALEYQNAQLRWNKWTLSQAARARLLAWIADPARLEEPQVDRQACLTLGLSLLTGRSLTEVAMPMCATGQPALEAAHPLGIDCDGCRLYLYPGQPQLRRAARHGAPFCRPTGGLPSVLLPTAWRRLIGQQGQRGPRAARAIVHRARQQLQALRGEWPALHFTEKGIRLALPVALAEQTRGDLGAEEVLTAGAEANARNIIHYASYGVVQIDRWWADAVAALVGEPAARPTANSQARLATRVSAKPLTAGVMPDAATPYVGSQHAFDLDQLAGYFAEIRARLHQAEVAPEWPRAFNLLTLYLSYWLGLGLAGRKSLTPVPDLMLAEGWALVADKHRVGGSTDRLVPLTPGLLAQIDAYVAFASELAVTVPELEPIVHTPQGAAVRLHYIWWTKARPIRKVVPYQPLYQEQVEQLTPLPGNWGRKVVRSASTALPGRYRDAALGHWVRGRHAWDATSTFITEDFRAQYLALQAELEARLGFEVVTVAGCRTTARPWRHLSSQPPVDPEPPPAPPPVTLAAAQALLEATDPVRCAALMAVTKAPDFTPADALGLAEDALRTRQGEAPEQLVAWAEAVCRLVRKQRGIPLFAVTPRPLFANKVVLQAAGLHTLGYLQQQILPAFLRDLACLPGRAAPWPAVAAPAEGAGAESLSVPVPSLADPGEGPVVTDGAAAETGRAAASADFDPAASVTDPATRALPEVARGEQELGSIASASLGAAGVTVVDSANVNESGAVASEAPDSAVASDSGSGAPEDLHEGKGSIEIDRLDGAGSRAVRQTQRAELGRLLMVAIWRLGLARWSLIEAWLQALYRRNPVLAQGPNRYMVLHVVCGPTRQLVRRVVFLDDFTAAWLAVEHATLPVWLRDLFAPPTTPRRRRARAEAALRGYLAALGAPLDGLSLARVTAAAAQQLLLHGAPIVAAYAQGDLVTEDLGDTELRRLAGLEPSRNSGAGGEPALPATKDPGLADAELPHDLLPKLPIMQIMGRHSSKYKENWKQRIGAYQPRNPMEQLLQAFALWLVDHGDQQATAKTLSERQKRHLSARIQVVAAALIGHVAPVVADAATGDAAMAGTLQLDERTLTALQELTRGQFPDRVHHGAWFHFYRFLADPDADHAGWALGTLGPAPERAISAKILTALELQALARELASVRSGIGKPELRTSAAHHVALMQTYGLRRAESAYLRGVDFQEDLCRVQAYGSHTLKTAWADRVLPKVLAAPTIAAWMGAACGAEKLIDVDAHTPTRPDNFFDAVSRLVKQVTGDPSMASHHLRHTVINCWVLTLLSGAAGLRALAADLPWLHGLLLEAQDVAGLLGSEGNAGQGLRAVAALVGHSHPTTTLRHYVHVMGIVLHGALEYADALDMAHSFERRIGGKSTLYRWNQELRARYARIADEDVCRRRRNRALRDRIEQRYPAAPIDRDEAPRKVTAPSIAPSAGERADEVIDFDAIEQVDRVLRYGLGTLDPSLQQRYVNGLRALSRVRSGKRGERYRMRHKAHEVRAHPHTLAWLPRALPAGTAVEAAQVLCAWLENLRVRRPEDFAWLVSKWYGVSSRERGRMRLDGPSEIERAKSLSDSSRVCVVIQYAVVAKARRKGAAQRVPRLRIKCVNAHGRVIVRDTIATRWVLSYVAAYDPLRRVAPALASLPAGTQLGLFDPVKDHAGVAEAKRANPNWCTVR